MVDEFDDTEYQGSGEPQSFWERAAERWQWIALIVIISAGFAAVDVWLLRDAQCRRFEWLFLGVVTLLFCFLSICFALFTPKSGLTEKLASAAIVAVSVPIILAAGPYLAEDSQIVKRFCPPADCANANAIQQLIDAGNASGARTLAQACMAENAGRPDACGKTCGCGLTKALVALVREQIQRKEYQQARATLNEAIQNNQTYHCEETGALAALDELLKSVNTTPTAMPSPTTAPTATPSPTTAPTPRPLSLTILKSNIRDGKLVVDVKVTEQGKLVSGLPPASFAIAVDGASTNVLSVSETREADPVCIVALIDNSSSIVGGLGQIQNAVDVLNQRRHPNDELGLVVFALDITQTVPPAAGASLDSNSIDGTGQATWLWRGVQQAIETAGSCSSRNRYIVLITDGTDNSGLFPSDEDAVAQLSRQAGEQDVKICAIGVDAGFLKPEPLEQLAQATGCSFYPANNFDAVASLVEKIVGDIRNFYRLEADGMNIAPGPRKGLLRVDAAEATFDFQR